MERTKICSMSLWPWPLTYGSKRIIFGLWPTKTLILVSLNLIGFKLLSGQGFYVHGHCDFWPTDPKINRNNLWVIPIMVSLSLIGFKFSSGQGFHAPGHCDLDLWFNNSKIKRDHLWAMLTKTSIMGPLSSIGFKLLGGQGFYVQCHCDLYLWPTGPKVNRGHIWVTTEGPFGRIKSFPTNRDHIAGLHLNMWKNDFIESIFC